jgi:hypothetical protein
LRGGWAIEDADARGRSGGEGEAAEKRRGSDRGGASFGVPSLVIDGHVFWGQDSAAMALDYLEHPEHFATPEMRRLANLPVGASRA